MPKDNKQSPFETGDPDEPIRLIPHSGSDPDLRDEVNCDLEDRLMQLDEKIQQLDSKIDQLSESGDYQDKAKRDALVAERDELVTELRQVGKDLEIGMKAVFEEYLGGPIETKF